MSYSRNMVHHWCGRLIGCFIWNCLFLKTAVSNKLSVQFCHIHLFFNQDLKFYIFHLNLQLQNSIYNWCSWVKLVKLIKYFAVYPLIQSDNMVQNHWSIKASFIISHSYCCCQTFIQHKALIITSEASFFEHSSRRHCMCEDCLNEPASSIYICGRWKLINCFNRHYFILNKCKCGIPHQSCPRLPSSSFPLTRSRVEAETPPLLP